MPLSQAIGEYLAWLELDRHASTGTVEGYRGELRRFSDFAGGDAGIPDIAELDRDILRGYQRHLTRLRTGPKGARRPLAISTRSRRLVALRSFLRFAAREEWLPGDLGTGIDVPKLPERLPKPSTAAASRRLQEGAGMDLLLLTADPGPHSMLPALSLLGHGVRSAAPEVAALLDAGSYDAVFVDARSDLAGSRSLCRLVGSTGLEVPVVVVISEGALVALSAEWGCDEFLLPTAGPAEVDARLRLLVARRSAERRGAGRRGALMVGELVIDESTYTVRLRGRPLEFTYKEFELLKYLAQHAGRVFTRAQLLQEVWGYDFFGGTRTVDVHVRRLRAKLGPEHEQLIATVRNVGYKFVRPVRNMSSQERTGQGHGARHDAKTADADADAGSGWAAAGSSGG